MAMKTHSKVELDKVGACASAICAVHCLITGVAFGFLTVAGGGFLGSLTADIAFLSVAVLVASVAIFFGFRKHHSYRPAIIFLAGLTSIILGHFVFRHAHAADEAITGWDHLLSTFFSVMGGVCLVAFHLVNMRLQNRGR